MKNCTVCFQSKSEKDFRRRGRPSNDAPLQETCKHCRYLAKNKQKGRYDKRLIQRYMELIYAAYGALCACCGEKTRKFLSIDHVYNNGSQERREFGATYLNFLRRIMRRGYPEDYQILCMNCNWGKMRNKGVCPHKTGEGLL